MAIDRRALVARHDVVLRAPDSNNPLTVGNGDFAITVDITGMQTFTRFHDPRGVLDRAITNTCTQSSWGWHQMPIPNGYDSIEELATAATTQYATERGEVPYCDQFDMWSMFGAPPDPNLIAGTWLHTNPQRLDLGRVGLVLRSDPNAAPEEDPTALSETEQRLDVWSGTITSSFVYAGEPVSVVTAAHPDRDQVAFRITSRLLSTGQLSVRLAFPYASDDFFLTSDWDAPDRHRTRVRPAGGGAIVERTIDSTDYTVEVAWTGAHLRSDGDAHTVEIAATGDELDLVVTYCEGHHRTQLDAPEASAVFNAAAAWWEDFWRSGAAIDFSRCTDPRAAELERRVVLSQYLTAVNCSGSLPPPESGLIANSWQGKFHLEMHWWHAAHFASWGRSHLLERSLGWYRSILPSAVERAHEQGYDGARWPKQVGPDGRDSPNETGPFLIWQQPHPLYYAELLHRADPDADRIEGLAELVDVTARFMASFVEWRDGTCHLAPPLVPAQECYDRHTTEDPTFELAYWWWGLEIAQRWRERRGLEREPGWTRVQDGLARPHTTDGRYDAIAVEPYLKREDHPSLLAALGVVPPTPLVDIALMATTLDDVLADWDWDSAWGWDFPTMAMTATRLGRPEIAVDALLMDRPKNVYLPTGHNAQRGNRLPLYLPGNGGLLAAVSLMAGGYEHADGAAPGFPRDGTWDVVVEGFNPWP